MKRQWSDTKQLITKSALAHGSVMLSRRQAAEYALFKKTTTQCCFLIVFIKEELSRSHGSCCFFSIFPPSSFSYTGCLFLALSLPCLSSLVGSTGAIKLWFLFGNFIILPWFVEASGGNDWTVTSKQCGSFWHSAAKHRSALLLTEPRTKVLIPCLPLAVPPH